jgi:hypothetical protein
MKRGPLANRAEVSPICTTSKSIPIPVQPFPSTAKVDASSTVFGNSMAGTIIDGRNYHHHVWVVEQQKVPTTIRMGTIIVFQLGLMFGVDRGLPNDEATTKHRNRHASRMISDINSSPTTSRSLCMSLGSPVVRCSSGELHMTPVLDVFPSRSPRAVSMSFMAPSTSSRVQPFLCHCLIRRRRSKARGAHRTNVATVTYRPASIAGNLLLPRDCPAEDHIVWIDNLAAKGPRLRRYNVSFES